MKNGIEFIKKVSIHSTFKRKPEAEQMRDSIHQAHGLLLT